jgi:hypothetical protein
MVRLLSQPRLQARQIAINHCPDITKNHSGHTGLSSTAVKGLPSIEGEAGIPPMLPHNIMYKRWAKTFGMRAVTEISQSRKLPHSICLYFSVLASIMAMSNLQTDQQLYSMLHSAYTKFLACQSSDPLHVMKDWVIKLENHTVCSALLFLLE